MTTDTELAIDWLHALTQPDPDPTLIASLETAAHTAGFDLTEVLAQLTPDRQIDQLVTTALTAAPWNPDLHPRGRDGKFIEVMGIVELFDFQFSTKTGKQMNMTGRRGKVMGINPDPKSPGKPNIRVGVFDKDGKPSLVIDVKPDNVAMAPEKARLDAPLGTPNAPDTPEAKAMSTGAPDPTELAKTLNTLQDLGFKVDTNDDGTILLTPPADTPEVEVPDTPDLTDDLPETPDDIPETPDTDATPEPEDRDVFSDFMQDDVWESTGGGATAQMDIPLDDGGRLFLEAELWPNDPPNGEYNGSISAVWFNADDEGVRSTYTPIGNQSLHSGKETAASYAEQIFAGGIDGPTPKGDTVPDTDVNTPAVDDAIPTPPFTEGSSDNVDELGIPNDYKTYALGKVLAYNDGEMSDAERALVEAGTPIVAVQMNENGTTSAFLAVKDATGGVWAGENPKIMSKFKYDGPNDPESLKAAQEAHIREQAKIIGGDLPVRGTRLGKPIVDDVPITDTTTEPGVDDFSAPVQGLIDGTFTPQDFDGPSLDMAVAELLDVVNANPGSKPEADALGNAIGYAAENGIDLPETNKKLGITVTPPVAPGDDQNVVNPDGIDTENQDTEPIPTEQPAPPPVSTADKAVAAGAVTVGKFLVPDQYAGLTSNDEVFAQVPQSELRLLDGSTWATGDKVVLPKGEVGTITGLASNNPSALKHYGLIKVDVGGKITKRSVTSLRSAGDGSAAPAPDVPSTEADVPEWYNPVQMGDTITWNGQEWRAKANSSTPAEPGTGGLDDVWEPVTPPQAAPDVQPAPPTPTTQPITPTFPANKRIEAGQVLSDDNEVLTLDGALAEVGLPIKSYRDGGMVGIIESLDPDETVAWVRLEDGTLVGRPRNTLKFFGPEPAAGGDVLPPL